MSRFHAGTAVSLLAVALAACAVNPATGERQLSFVGEGQEIAMGRESDPGIVAQMGLYPDSAVQRYVRDLGLRMAALSERPDLPWTFRVLDDPTVNAFALPGGFIYITRGIMTHLTSEAQLAGILGHEIGHVTARHSVNQMSRTQLAQVGLIVGMVVSETVRDYGGVAAQGIGLLSLSFGRDDELQADELGLRYMTRLGYDPSELAGVMEMLARNSELSAGEGGRIPEWLSTHPNPENRVQRIEARIDATPAYASATTVAVGPFMDRIDGMVFGEDPREGYVEAGVYHHPDLAFRFTVPDGWSLFNGRQAVQLGPEDGSGAIQVTAGDVSPEEAARRFAARENVQAGAARSGTVNGLPTVTVPYRATSQDGEVAGEATWVRHGDLTYAFLAISSPTGWQAFGPRARAVVGSFGPETDPDVLGAQPMEVAVVTLSNPLPWSEFLTTYPSVIDEREVAVINQVAVGERVPAGAVKRVVR